MTAMAALLSPALPAGVGVAVGAGTLGHRTNGVKGRLIWRIELCR